jgi:hypothetical protein
MTSSLSDKLLRGRILLGEEGEREERGKKGKKGR